jgi:hypothetical protein
MLRTLPKEFRQDVRDQIDELVKVTTWNRKGEAFEFAHFTDRQLASAILSIPGARKELSLATMTGHVAKLRRLSGNLKELLPRRSSKLELADSLWPVLERKITRAIARGTEPRIPIARILDEAVALAFEFPRSGVVIGLPSSDADPT